MAMSYGQGGTTEQIRGTVEQANEKGLKIGGRWFNFSQYSKSTLRPVEGDEVELEVARGKFINDVKITGSGEGGSGSGSGDVDGAGFDFANAEDDPFEQLAARPGSGGRGTPAPRQSGTAPSSGMDRNGEIRRLALIKAAAEYAAGREVLTPDDVLAIATQWEGWVLGTV